MRDLTLRASFFLMRVLAIPFVLFVVALNVAHPLLHSFEGGALDTMLPMLDTTAIMVGGGRVIAWAKRHGLRHHDHSDHDCTLG